jgi:hypothetical protein
LCEYPLSATILRYSRVSVCPGVAKPRAVFPFRVLQLLQLGHPGEKMERGGQMVFRVCSRVLVTCAALMIISVVAVASQKVAGKNVEEPTPVSIFKEITKFFVEAENWGIPYLPVHVAFLDLILALDTCSSYRKHMGKESHPILQVRIFFCDY